MAVNPSQLKSSDDQASDGTDDKLKNLLKKNLELTEKIYKNSRYIKRFVITSQIIGALKLLLIVVPIVLGIIYLPPLLKEIKPMMGEVIKTYQELLGIKDQVDEAGGKIDLDKLPPEARKYLK